MSKNKQGRSKAYRPESRLQDEREKAAAAKRKREILDSIVEENHKF